MESDIGLVAVAWGLLGLWGGFYAVLIYRVETEKCFHRSHCRLFAFLVTSMLLGPPLFVIMFVVVVVWCHTLLYRWYSEDNNGEREWHTTLPALGTTWDMTRPSH